jgi:hypothetical protein
VSKEARIQAHLDQADWQGVARYHVCIFSNFLTSSAQVLSLASELTHVFRALKPRGIVIIVGASGGKYSDLYEKLDEVAGGSKVQPVSEVPSALPCNYDGAEAEQIKKLYRSVFEALEEVVLFDDHLKKQLSRDLWDPNTPLRGPKAFGVRVYRAPDRPPGARFTNRGRRTAHGVPRVNPE